MTYEFDNYFVWRQFRFIKCIIVMFYPGRTCTVVNDRLRWRTETYGGRTQNPYTGTVYGVKRWEMDTVYGDRMKIRSDFKVTVCTPYTELYDCRIRSYIIVCGRIRLQYASLFRFTLEVSEYINSKYFWFFSLTFLILDHFDPTVQGTVSIFYLIQFICFRSFWSNNSTNSR